MSGTVMLSFGCSAYAPHVRVSCSWCPCTAHCPAGTRPSTPGSPCPPGCRRRWSCWSSRLASGSAATTTARPTTVRSGSLPPACAVAEPHRRYSGETRFPLVLQKLHRYFFLAGVLFTAILSYDAALAFDFAGHLGMGLGTLILLVNAALIWGYTLGCPSCRHIIGGRLRSFSRHPVCYRLWVRCRCSTPSTCNGHGPAWPGSRSPTSTSASPPAASSPTRGSSDERQPGAGHYGCRAAPAHQAAGAWCRPGSR